MNMVIILSVAIVSWAPAHQIIKFKYVQFFVCQVYLSKPK